MTKIEDAVAVDFETEAIDRRPRYPPRPVSVSIVEPGRPAEFLAWGHPVGNNCTIDTAKIRLRALWKSDAPLAFHNSKFDLDVAEAHLNLPLPDWRRCHDTLFLAFLDDPFRRSLVLGDLTVDVLKRSAKFKDGKLRDWVLTNVPELKRRPSEWGAHLSKAPAQLVQARATGDATATRDLFVKLMGRVAKRGMGAAYDRERRLLPCLLDSERRGVRVAHRRLARDLELYAKFLEEVDAQVRRSLKSNDLDVGSPAQLFRALEAAGKLESVILTKKGNPSTSKEALEECIGDKKILALLKLRGVLATCVGTFMRPWLLQADQTNGLIHTQWNQVRQPEGGGARTGRLSSTPNFQNILNPDRIGALLIEVERRWPLLGAALKLNGAPLVPQLRDYIVPDTKHDVLLVRDYQQQEMRILAHFEDGALLAKYRADPTLDVHNAARDLIQEMLGLRLDRRPVKDTGFGLVYGLGVAGLAKKIDTTTQEARELRNAYLRAMPGIKVLGDEMKRRAAANQSIRTWGGREYFCEAPKFIDGRMRTFEYRLINILIQGSAADDTKEATARYWESRHDAPDGARFMMTVHDETVVNAPKKNMKRAMRRLRETMESVEFDLPMLSDGKSGPTWARLKKFNDER